MKEALVDSSVILDIFTSDPVFYENSLAALSLWGASHELCINDIIYAEVSVGFKRIEDLNTALGACGFIHRAIPMEALFLAAKAFQAYRKRGGQKTSTLPDFFIGAHAAVKGIPLITRDPHRVKKAYPRLELIQP